MLNEKKYIVIITILSAMVLLMVFVIISPSVAKIKNNKNIINQQYSKLRQLIEKGQVTSRIKNDFELVKNGLDSIGKIFLTNGDELEFITSLESVARENNVEQDISFNLSDFSDINGYKTIPLKISASGNPENIISYINQIEALDYYINFNDIEILNKGYSTNIKRYSSQIENEVENTEQQQVITINLVMDGDTYWHK